MQKQGKVVFNENKDNKLVFYYDDVDHGGETFLLDDYNYDYSIGAEWNALAYHPKYTRIRDGYIKTIEIDKSMKDYKPKSCAGWFTGNKIVGNIKGLNYLDLSECTSCARMFGDCESIYELDVSNFIAPKCTSYMGMFEGCIRLNKLVGTDKFDTKSCTDFSQMFTGTQLSKLDVSSFDTSKAEQMYGMFAGNARLRAIYGLKNFDTSNVYSFTGMFTNCAYLLRIDVSNFDTQNMRDGFDMFRGCLNVRELDMSNWKLNYDKAIVDGELKVNPETRAITDISCMFSGCDYLEKIYMSENMHTYLKLSGIKPFMKIPKKTEIIINNKVKSPSGIIEINTKDHNKLQNKPTTKKNKILSSIDKDKNELNNQLRKKCINDSIKSNGITH